MKIITILSLLLLTSCQIDDNSYTRPASGLDMDRQISEQVFDVERKIDKLEALQLSVIKSSCGEILEHRRLNCQLNFCDTGNDECVERCVNFK